jgi:hypothetical protein
MAARSVPASPDDIPPPFPNKKADLAIGLGIGFNGVSAGSHHHGGAADADHQHAAILAHHLVVDVDAHHGVGPQRLGTPLSSSKAISGPGPALS